MQNVSILKLLNLIILSSLFFLSLYKISYAEMSSLGVLTGGTSSYAQGASSDGSVIVGWSGSTYYNAGARKNVDGTMTS